MATLVDSLLFLARADSNQQIIDKQPFSLTSAVIRTVLPFKPVAANKGIFIELISDTDIGYTGDEARLKQVIGILLDNAAIQHLAALL